MTTLPEWVLKELEKMAGLPPLGMPMKKEVKMDQWNAAKRIREICNSFSKSSYDVILEQKTTTTNSCIDNLETAISKRKTKEIREALALVKINFITEREFIKGHAPMTALAEIKSLSSYLPTDQSLPQGKAENTLRAIRAILKNSEGEPSGAEKSPEEPAKEQPSGFGSYIIISSDSSD